MGIDAGPDPEYAARSQKLVNEWGGKVNFSGTDREFESSLELFTNEAKKLNRTERAQLYGAFSWWRSTKSGNTTWQTRLEVVLDKLQETLGTN